MKLFSLLILSLINSINCFFYYFPNKTLSIGNGRLNLDNFNIIPLSNDTLPSGFILKADSTSFKFNHTFYKIEGILNDPSWNNKIYVMDDDNKVVPAETQSLKYALYRGDNNAYATLIRNSDLKNMSLSYARSFRVIVTIENDNGTRFDLYPALFNESNVDKPTFSQIYIKQNNNFKKYDDHEYNDGSGDYKGEEIEENEEEFKVFNLKKPNDEEFDVLNINNKRYTFNDDLLIDDSLSKINYKPRAKRGNSFLPVIFNVEYLIVLDSTVFNKFKKNYPNLQDELIFQYMKIFYSHVVNGIDSRYESSTKNDPDLSISVHLANLLVLTDPANTPWTNRSIVGFANYPTYNGNIPISTTKSLSTFRDFMNKLDLPFDYDHAVAIVDMDLWNDNAALAPNVRAGPIGYAYVGAVCGNNRYSIVEEIGFNNIQNGAHELGHSLGSFHDGDNRPIASLCPASLNHIMTPISGAFTNAKNLYRFSNCSLIAFKNTLFNPTRTNYTLSGKCLLNSPIDRLPGYFTNTTLPGKLWSLDDQCKAYLGPTSNYQRCRIKDDPVCQSLACFNGKSCVLTEGLGALDGSPCGDKKICFKSQCVNDFSSSVVSTCSPNPCLNNGVCVSLSKTIFVCNCTDKFTGSKCEILKTTTKPKPVTRPATKKKVPLVRG